MTTRNGTCLLPWTGFFGAETSWALDGTDVFLGSPPYPTGINTYDYELCLFPGCYTLTIEDVSGDGMPYGGEVQMTVDGVNIPVDITGEWAELTFEFCVTADECPYDLDGNGNIGNGDLLILLTEYGCTAGCNIDFNNDGTTDVNDLLAFLNQWGLPCSSEFLNNPPTRFFPLESQIYDLTGRPISQPLDGLPSGIYIRVSPEGVEKLYKQFGS